MTSRPTPAPVNLDKSRALRIDVPFKFLTPVFGGGVEHQDLAHQPSKPFDPITPVRSSGVRGQLRFWWRATTGVRCKSLAEMRKREAAIWGGVWDFDGGSNPGVVGITIDSEGDQFPEPLLTFEWPQEKRFPRATREARDLDYITFPLRPENNPGTAGPDPRSALWDHGANQYKLAVDLLDVTYEEEIRLAISAWLTVGGYGGRTTRGFGAVALVESTLSGVTDCPDQLRELLMAKGSPQFDGVPTLTSNSKNWMLRSGKNPRDSWSKLITEFKKFRQGKGLGRNSPASGSKSPAGRSRWPEPDAIRAITRRSSSEHSDPVNAANAFPRADFGLPIIFHFKDGKDPDDTTLQPSKDSSRFPSPMLLRPCSDGRGMVVRLVGVALPKEVYLQGNRANRAVAKDISPSAMNALRSDHRRLVDPDPITAFMNYIR